MTFYIPQYKAFCGAEVVSPHPAQPSTPLRGAGRPRRAGSGSGYIDEAITLFGQGRRGVFRQPPLAGMGQERINSFLKSQRDTYKFIHDQTPAPQRRLHAEGKSPPNSSCPPR